VEGHDDGDEKRFCDHLKTPLARRSKSGDTSGRTNSLTGYSLNDLTQADVRGLIRAISFPSFDPEDISVYVE
jgi:hypothetical protein